MENKQEIDTIQLYLLRLAKAIDEGKKSDELLGLLAETLALTHRLRGKVI